MREGVGNLGNEFELVGGKHALIVMRDIAELRKIPGDHGDIGVTTGDEQVYMHNGATWVHRPEMQHVLLNDADVDEWGLPADVSALRES